MDQIRSHVLSLTPPAGRRIRSVRCVESPHVQRSTVGMPGNRAVRKSLDQICMSGSISRAARTPETSKFGHDPNSRGLPRENGCALRISILILWHTNPLTGRARTAFHAHAFGPASPSLLRKSVFSSSPTK